MTGYRLPSGGRIDRGRLLTFTFDGREYQGFHGDTLAAALIANGVSIVGRSFKYHRPRGVFAAGSEEPNALIQLGVSDRTEPNLKATQIELFDGLVASSVNTYPSADFDIRAIHDRFSAFLPGGFYYKTFMWPDWHLFEGPIRRAAGLGRAPIQPDPDSYEHLNARCDVLVVGAGAAGLSAALVAAEAGSQVTLVDEGSELGGSLLWYGGETASVWSSEVCNRLRAAGVRLLPRTTAFGYFDHNLVAAVERVTDHLGPEMGPGVRQRLWRIRASKVVLATGAHERPLVFANNDRPGVMLSSAAVHYVRRYGVAPGRRTMIFTTNDGAYRDALELQAAGIEVVAVVDPRPAVESLVRDQLRQAGIPVLAGEAVVDVKGTARVKAAVLRDVARGRERALPADLICVSGGWSPAVHLFSQSGGSLRFCEERLMFVPARSAQAEVSVGAANGTLDLPASIEEGAQAGAEAAGAAATPSPMPAFTAQPSGEALAPLALWSPVRDGKAFVDLANDVTARDIALAARENYVSVEHLKRYTTLGMGSDQGKTSNVNGLAIMGEVTGRRPGGVGTTKFRPPYTPVALGAIVGPYRGELFRPRRYLPAHAWHVSRGALFEEFGGWERPAAYPKPGETLEAAAEREALAVRKGVGAFEGSPIGKIEVAGPDAGKFLDRMYVGNAFNLKVGRARYGLMLNENGVVIDDGVCVRLEEQRFLVHTTSGGADRIAALMEEWLQCEWVDLDVTVVNATAQWANLTLSGPKARAVFATLMPSFDISAEGFPHMAYREGAVLGVDARVLRASFTGEVSYEINVPARYGQALFDAAWEAGQAHGLVPYGIEALMLLRTEKGYLHVGVDTDGTTLPDDVGMAGAVAKKVSDFVGRRSLSRSEATRPGRLQFVGLASLDGVLPVGAQALGGDAPPCDSDGFVTSSYMSPALGKPVALGLIRDGRRRVGETIVLYDMGRRMRATITGPTFYDPNGERLDG